VQRVIPSVEAAPLCRRIWLFALLSVAAVVAVVFLLPENLYLASKQWDLPQFAAWRAFAVDNIRAGHFPLWNPYAYSGQPFLGDFNSAELYPPNVIFLFLPLARAFNLSLLLHLLILGWGVGYWAAQRGIRPVAAALAGVAAMLSGPVFMRLPAGQVGNICSMAWAPWMFCALEAAWQGRPGRPALLAGACVALQILGGQPQYAVFVAVAAGLHTMVYALAKRGWWRKLWVLAFAYAVGLLLSAMQWLPGLAATAESVRQGKLPYDFARESSFPPENVLTLLTPEFFGHMFGYDYWGRIVLWESCLFVGVSGVALAAVALVGRERGRQARLDILLAGLLFILALGDYTPLQHLMYDYVPGFGEMRAFAKFDFPALLFVALAIGAGADAILNQHRVNPILATGLVGAGLAGAGVGGWLWLSPASVGGWIKQNDQGQFSIYLKDMDATFINQAGKLAGWSLAVGGLLLALAGLILLLARRQPRWGLCLLVMLPLELLAFAGNFFATTPAESLSSQTIGNILASHPGDYRIFNTDRADADYFYRVPSIWDDSPSVLKRYAEFVYASQGADPGQATQTVSIKKLPPVYSLLRMKYAFVTAAISTGSLRVGTNPNPLPRAILASDYRVLPGRDAILPMLMRPDFDPRQLVYLENEPNPKPQIGATLGTVTAIEDNSDQLTIAADVPVSALLLVTDLYSQDWRARALQDSVQKEYTIMPADYIVRAVPLSAGHHHFIMEYAPPSFRQGLWTSAIAWIGWAALMMAANFRAGKACS